MMKSFNSDFVFEIFERCFDYHQSNITFRLNWRNLHIKDYRYEIINCFDKVFSSLTFHQSDL